VVGGIVGFNVAADGRGRYVKATRGELYARAHPLLEHLGFTLVPDMRPIEWGKLLLNLNNAVNALSGLPLRAALSQRGYRRVVAAAMSEALAVAHAIGIEPARLGPLPPAALPRLLATPDWLFDTVLLPLQGISATSRLSMSADYDAARPTEVHELNGAVVALGANAGVPTPVNAALVELIDARGGHLDATAMQRAVGL
jgi:2-dehydropantoate 2-reductase